MAIINKDLTENDIYQTAYLKMRVGCRGASKQKLQQMLSGKTIQDDNILYAYSGNTAYVDLVIGEKTALMKFISLNVDFLLNIFNHHEVMVQVFPDKKYNSLSGIKTYIENWKKAPKVVIANSTNLPGIYMYRGDTFSKFEQKVEAAVENNNNNLIE